MRATAVALMLALATAGRAHADEAAVATTARPAPPPYRHAVYVELLGKSPAWGVGYDLALEPWLALGVTASFHQAGGERLITASPYLMLYLLGARRHRGFVQAGPEVVHLARPSPVPEWPGMSETGVGGQLSLGWEYRRARVVTRTFVTATGGGNGIVPMLGVDVGVRF